MAILNDKEYLTKMKAVEEHLQTKVGFSRVISFFESYSQPFTLFST